jgi:hypothetical protein
MRRLLEWEHGELRVPAYIEITPDRFAPIDRVVTIDLYEGSTIIQCVRCIARWLARNARTGQISRAWWQCPNDCLARNH